jgi:hypothetical protein
MTGWRTTTRKTALPLAAFLLAMIVMCGVAYGSVRTQVVLTAGSSLEITDPIVGDFGAVLLDGAAQQATATLTNLRVTDPRGTGEGWHVTVQATQFTDQATLRTLPPGSLSMATPGVVQHDPTSSALPTLFDGPYYLDSGSAVHIASAAVGDGMGSYDFTPGADLTLSVGANAFAGTYVSTVIVSVVAGP